MGTAATLAGEGRIPHTPAGAGDGVQRGHRADRVFSRSFRFFSALYGSSELSRRYLARSSPTSQHHMLLYLAKTTYLCWGHLAQAVRWARRGPRRRVLGAWAGFRALRGRQGRALAESNTTPLALETPKLSAVDP